MMEGHGMDCHGTQSCYENKWHSKYKNRCVNLQDMQYILVPFSYQ